MPRDKRPSKIMPFSGIEAINPKSEDENENEDYDNEKNEK